MSLPFYSEAVSAIDADFAFDIYRDMVILRTSTNQSVNESVCNASYVDTGMGNRRRGRAM